MKCSTLLTSLLLVLSETRLLEIVEAACEKSDFDCNKLLEQLEDQVETWWFHRYVCHSVSVLYLTVNALNAVPVTLNHSRVFL